MSRNVRVTKRKHHIPLINVTFLRFVLCFLRFVMFMFWNYYVLKLLHLETITFSDATLSNINVVLCYVLSQSLRTLANIFNIYNFVQTLNKALTKEILD
jgi:hypothetical protein